MLCLMYELRGSPLLNLGWSVEISVNISFVSSDNADLERRLGFFTINLTPIYAFNFNYPFRNAIFSSLSKLIESKHDNCRDERS
jgi:hypothetical protein